MRSNVWLAIILLAWVSAWASPPRAEAQDEHTKKPLPAVSVRVVGPSAAGGGVRYAAEMQSFKQVDVAFNVGGYIQEILQVPGVDRQKRTVQAGDRVTKGTVLAQVREIDYIMKVHEARTQRREKQDARSQDRAQLVEAQAARERVAAQLLADEASFEIARRDFEHSSILFATQSLTTEAFDGSKAHFEDGRARVEAAHVQLELAQANEERVKGQSQGSQARVDGAQEQLDKEELALRDSALKAPFDGVILKRSIEVGTLVEAKTVGFVLADTSSMKAVFGVPADTVKHLQVGRILALSFEALPGVELHGPITRISPAVGAKTRVFDMEVTLPNPSDQLKIGFIGALEIGENKSAGSVAAVPLTAIVRPKNDPAGYAVFVVQEQEGKSVARLRKVKLGDALGNMIAIVDGVQLGERVITTGASLVVDGAPVQILP